METTTLTLLIFLLVLAVFLGQEIFSKTPVSAQGSLLSSANAVSGIGVLGTVMTAGLAENAGNNDLAALLGGLALALALVNVAAGYLGTGDWQDQFRNKQDK